MHTCIFKNKLKLKLHSKTNKLKLYKFFLRVKSFIVNNLYLICLSDLLDIKIEQKVLKNLKNKISMITTTENGFLQKNSNLNLTNRKTFYLFGNNIHYCFS